MDGGCEVGQDLIHEQSSDPAEQLTIQLGCPLPPKSAPKLLHSDDDADDDDDQDDDDDDNDEFR